MVTIAGDNPVGTTMDFEITTEILRAILNCNNKASPTDIYNCLNEHSENPPVPVHMVSSTLVYLENEGYVSKSEESGPKYSITDAGRKYLDNR